MCCCQVAPGGLCDRELLYSFQYNIRMKVEVEPFFVEFALGLSEGPHDRILHNTRVVFDCAFNLIQTGKAYFSSNGQLGNFEGSPPLCALTDTSTNFTGRNICEIDSRNPGDDDEPDFISKQTWRSDFTYTSTGSGVFNRQTGQEISVPGFDGSKPAVVPFVAGYVTSGYDFYEGLRRHGTPKEHPFLPSRPAYPVNEFGFHRNYDFAGVMSPGIQGFNLRPFATMTDTLEPGAPEEAVAVREEGFDFFEPTSFPGTTQDDQLDYLPLQYTTLYTYLDNVDETTDGAFSYSGRCSFRDAINELMAGGYSRVSYNSSPSGVPFLTPSPKQGVIRPKDVFIGSGQYDHTKQLLRSYGVLGKIDDVGQTIPDIFAGSGCVDQPAGYPQSMEKYSVGFPILDLYGTIPGGATSYRPEWFIGPTPCGGQNEINFFNWRKRQRCGINWNPFNRSEWNDCNDGTSTTWYPRLGQLGAMSYYYPVNGGIDLQLETDNIPISNGCDFNEATLDFDINRRTLSPLKVQLTGFMSGQIIPLNFDYSGDGTLCPTP